MIIEIKAIKILSREQVLLNSSSISPILHQ